MGTLVRTLRTRSLSLLARLLVMFGIFLSVTIALSSAKVSDGVADGGDQVFVAGEEAMKNLEAAQVQMEQKLKIMTGFIDKELEKENEREIPKRKRRKRYSDKHPARNPLEHISANDVQEAVEEMDRLQKAFENLQDAFARNHPQGESDLIEDTEAPPPFAQFDEDVTTPNLENFNNEVTPAEVTPPVTLHESDKGNDVEESKKKDQNDDQEQSQADDNDEEKKEDGKNDDENNE